MFMFFFDEIILEVVIEGEVKMVLFISLKVIEFIFICNKKKYIEIILK